ncbi:MAG: GNAT family N-acetyltransferase [Promethearchaeota archaeon]
MKIYFRELVYDDIPAINDISKDIWEGRDYIPHVIEQWLKDENSMNYGAFKDENYTEMVAFSRVKLYDNDLAWLEGGRVKISYQRQGIGKAIAKFGIDYAYKLNVKVAQYSTSSQNLGSISIAKYFGFKRKKSMNVLDAERKNIKLSKVPSLKLEKMTLSKAKKLYKNYDIGPGDELCVGWSYIPIKYLSDDESEWYIYNSDAILQKIKFKRIQNKEYPQENEVWLIVYGKPKVAYELIQYILQEELKNRENTYFEIFCHPNVANLIEKIGFFYYEGKPFGVVLFEKLLEK